MSEKQKAKWLVLGMLAELLFVLIAAAIAGPIYWTSPAIALTMMTIYYFIAFRDVKDD